MTSMTRINLLALATAACLLIIVSSCQTEAVKLNRDLYDTSQAQGRAVSCSVFLDPLTATLNYPANDELLVKFRYSSNCGEQDSDDESYHVNAGKIFERAESHGIQVIKAIADSTSKISLALKASDDLKQETLTFKASGESSEEYRFILNETSECELSVDISFSLNYQVVLEIHQVKQYSGIPDIRTATQLNCIGMDRAALTRDDELIRGVLKFVGLSVHRSFAKLDDFVSDDEDLVDDIGGSIRSHVEANIKTGVNDPVCVESAYIEQHKLQKVHQQDVYALVYCIQNSVLPCGTKDHLLEFGGHRISYHDYCSTTRCSTRVALVNGIKHSDADKLVPDGALQLTTMTSRTSKLGLYLTGLMQRHGMLLNVLDKMQRHEFYY